MSSYLNGLDSAAREFSEGGYVLGGEGIAAHSGSFSGTLEQEAQAEGEELDSGEQITGTRDEHYNLVSVLYHALHGAETIETYVLDAEAAGDELAAFLREVQETQRQVAERVKDRLGIVGVAPPGTVKDPLLETEAGAEPVDIRGRAAPEVGLPP